MSGPKRLGVEVLLQALKSLRVSPELKVLILETQESRNRSFTNQLETSFVESRTPQNIRLQRVTLVRMTRCRSQCDDWR
jgi:hypothetical protein